MAKPKPRNLSKSKKIVAAKILRDEEKYQYVEIADWLGISNDTARRYTQMRDPEGLREFESEFRAMIAGMKYEGIGNVYKRLGELVPKERRISEVVRAGEFYEGKSQTQTNVQINNVIADKKKEYDL